MIKMLIMGAGLKSTLPCHIWITIRTYKKAKQDVLNFLFDFATWFSILGFFIAYFYQNQLTF